MPIAVTPEQCALADALRDWMQRTDSIATTRAQETDPDAWRAGWAALAGLGALGVAVPEPAGGGGSLTDLAVAVETLAGGLAPGPVLSTAIVIQVLDGDREATDLALGTRTAGLALHAPGLRVEATADGPRLRGTATVLGAATDGILLLPVDGESGEPTWFIVDAASAKLAELDAADASCPLAEARFDSAPARALGDHPRVTDLIGALAVAEASGVAAWCLDTAATYARTREQFGRPIGSFQAVKQLCAGMLTRAEVAAALAWDAAESASDPDQHAVAVSAAVALVLDLAVDNAKDCIQVLGGIGFTWEHDAHRYLRRALAVRQWLGGGGHWRRRVAELTVAGHRRQLRVDAGDKAMRAQVGARVERIAALPASQQRAALADSGYLVPHWPAPYGLGADAAFQLVIDAELARAGVVRPNLVIANWAVPTILAHGTAEQADRFAAATLRGEITWCQLFSEPDAGSDLASLRTRAVRDDAARGWRLTGQKVWTSLAHEADWAICLARTDPDAPKHKGITYFLVDMRSAGIDIRPLREITGEALFNEVFLDDVFVPDNCVVGEVDGGWALARTTLAQERVSMGGASSIGDAVERLVATASASRALDDAVVVDRLGALIANGLAGSVLDHRSTLRSLAGATADPAAASVRKLVGVEHRQAVAEAALDLAGHGQAGTGLVASDELREFLTTRCLSIAGGTTQILRNVAVERVLGLPRSWTGPNRRALHPQPALSQPNPAN